MSRLKDDSKSESSELTREEYLQLLRTARKQGKEYLYLAIKMVGSTGCTMTELVDLTVEDVRESKMFVFRNGERKYQASRRTATGVIELRSAVRYLFWTNFSKRRGNYYKKSTGNALYHETVHSRRNSGRQRECQLYLGDVSDDEGSH